MEVNDLVGRDRQFSDANAAELQRVFNGRGWGIVAPVQGEDPATAGFAGGAAVISSLRPRGIRPRGRPRRAPPATRALGRRAMGPPAPESITYWQEEARARRCEDDRKLRVASLPARQHGADR